MDPNQTIVRISARDHMDSEGSVVRSGIKLAEAVLQHLENSAQVEIDLEGIKGASSSYFNVFLRRIEEGCGISIFDHQTKMRFSSNIQKMVYARSYESMKKGDPKSNNGSELAAQADHHSILSRFIQAIASWVK